jgi:hypothetical protein
MRVVKRRKRKMLSRKIIRPIVVRPGMGWS